MDSKNTNIKLSKSSTNKKTNSAENLNDKSKILKENQLYAISLYVQHNIIETIFILTKPNFVLYFVLKMSVCFVFVFLFCSKIKFFKKYFLKLIEG
jgi:hypothetical protein